MRIVRFWCLAGCIVRRTPPDRYWPMIVQFINGTIGPGLAVA